MGVKTVNKLIAKQAIQDTVGHVRAMELALKTANWAKNPEAKDIWIQSLRDGARAFVKLANKLEATNDL